MADGMKYSNPLHPAIIGPMIQVSTTIMQSLHLHLSPNCKGHWGTTDDFTTSFLHFFPVSTAPWDMRAQGLSIPWCLPISSSVCLLPSFTVSCKMVLARPDEQETWRPFSLHLFMMVRRSSSSPIAYWILALTSSMVTWSLYEMHSVLK